MIYTLIKVIIPSFIAIIKYAFAIVIILMNKYVYTFDEAISL